MRKPADEILEWTVSDRPFAEETERPPPETDAPPQPARASFRWPPWATSRRVALTTALTAALVLLAVWAGAAWADYQLKQEIQILVNVETFEIPLYAQSAPPPDFQLPLPLLQSPILSGTVQSLVRLNPELLRADVHRVFVDGLTQSAMTFLQPQFYRRTQAGWERTTPPEGFWGAEVLERGPRLTFRYQQIDTEFVTTLAPTLEKTLVSACQIWQCPPVSFTVQWVTGAENIRENLASRFGGFSANNYGSRTLALSAGPTFIFAGPEQVTLPSPHAIGLPADAASQKLYADTLSIMLLRKLALRLSYNRDSYYADDQNPFRLALVARMAARLGLDNTRLPELLNPNPHQQDDELWRMGNLDSNTLQSALVITNRLLQTQPITAEVKLLKALAHSDGVLSWMVDGLNLTTKEAIELSRAVNYQPWPIEKLATDPGEILLTCADGLQVWRANQEAPEPLLTGYFPGSHPTAFSPDGQKLIARISGQLAVIDFSTGTLIWLPNGHSAFGYQWLDNNTLAYQLYGEAGGGVRLYELYKGDVLAYDSDVFNYLLAPDKRQAIVERSQDNGQVMSVMPARGGEETTISLMGHSPRWSPTGDAVSFSYFDGFTQQIRVFVLPKNEERAIFSSDMLVEAHSASTLTPSYGGALAVWSPTAEWLAVLFTQSSDGSSYQYWIGLARRDGKEWRLIQEGQATQSALPLSLGDFSADGRYYAFVKQGEGLLIHDLEKNASRLVSMPNLHEVNSWSPSGYEMLVSTPQGIQRVHDAHQTNPHIETISGPECTGAMWVPQP